MVERLNRTVKGAIQFARLAREPRSLFLRRIDDLLAQTGGEGEHGSLDAAMVPPPDTPTEPPMGSEVDDLLREAQDMGSGVYDEDVRELIAMCSELSPQTTQRSATEAIGDRT